MSRTTVQRRIKALMDEWATLRFGLSEQDAAEAWAESMALHEETCPALRPQEPDDLGLAWAAAEAALPEGWSMRLHRYPAGARWYSAGAHDSQTRDGWTGGEELYPSPTAALLALAAKLADGGSR